MDIDMLGKTSNEMADVVEQVRDILAVNVEDGIIFDPDSIQTERITEDADYEGIRIRFPGALASAKINMQIDIGFGDIVYPKPEKSDLPVMLDSPCARLLCYSQERAITEKFEVMVKLGTLNSRMKDFYDIWLLARHFDFNGENLAEAIRLTFGRRKTALSIEIEAFTKPFMEAKQVQWTAFLKRLPQKQVPESFREIVTSLNVFLSPIVGTVTSGKPTPIHWNAPGPWQ